MPVSTAWPCAFVTTGIADDFGKILCLGGLSPSVTLAICSPASTLALGLLSVWFLVSPFVQAFGRFGFLLLELRHLLEHLWGERTVGYAQLTLHHFHLDTFSLASND